MTRASVLDADISEATVSVQPHVHDMENLAEDVGQRVVVTLKQHRTGSFYFNPIVTVSCPEPTEKFFRIIRKEQARWCRQAANTFPRNVRRSPACWIGGGQRINNKFDRYLDRAFCFTGVLFIDGQLVAPHNWPKIGSKKDRNDETRINTLDSEGPQRAGVSARTRRSEQTRAKEISHR